MLQNGSLSKESVTDLQTYRLADRETDKEILREVPLVKIGKENITEYNKQGSLMNIKDSPVSYKSIFSQHYKDSIQPR